MNRGIRDTCLLFAALLFTIILRPLLPSAVAIAAVQGPQTIIVTAEGLADPNAAIYHKDKGLMVDDLRRDAQRQAIEKAVGVYVESSTLVANYLLIEDNVLSKSQGLIKQILEETSPRLGEDGLMHMQIKAEVFLSEVKEALQSLSREKRLSLVKERGNPTISVAIVVRDAKRGTDTPPENSPIAENILKAHFVDFGYRVWSEDYTKLLQREAGNNSLRKAADFSVIGEAKFKQTSITLKASGLKLTKHVLTSWTVKCLNNHTGEEIYFNNKIPKNSAWADEDQALEDIGRLIGDEFNVDFFENQLNRPSQIYQIQLAGLPDYETALLFKDEFAGLRSIIGVALINFEMGGLSQFEVECTTTGNSNFGRILYETILKPLNAKLDGPKLQLMSQHGNVVRIGLSPGAGAEAITQAVLHNPPSSLALASPERIIQLIQDPKIREKIIRMNPSLAGALAVPGQ